jgi:hypothetical protein
MQVPVYTIHYSHYTLYSPYTLLYMQVAVYTIHDTHYTLYSLYTLLYMQVAVPLSGSFGYDMKLVAFPATSTDWVDKGRALFRLRSGISGG